MATKICDQIKNWKDHLKNDLRSDQDFFYNFSGIMEPEQSYLSPDIIGVDELKHLVRNITRTIAGKGQMIGPNYNDLYKNRYN
jgi:hypothetical protein